MKFVFLIGGFAGFIITGACSLWAAHPPDRALFDGAVGCLAGAVLFRWFWTVLLRGVRDSLSDRRASAAAAHRSK